MMINARLGILKTLERHNLRVDLSELPKMCRSMDLVALESWECLVMWSQRPQGRIDVEKNRVFLIKNISETILHGFSNDSKVCRFWRKKPENCPFR